MNTDARRKASAAFHAKRVEEGYRKVTLWLHADTREELERLGKLYGSKDRAAAIAIDHHAAERPEPVKAPPVARKSAPVATPAPKPAVPYGSRLKKR